MGKTKKGKMNSEQKIKLIDLLAEYGKARLNYGFEIGKNGSLIDQKYKLADDLWTKIIKFIKEL